MEKIVCGVVSRNRRVLLVKENSHWDLPGGVPKKFEVESSFLDSILLDMFPNTVFEIQDKYRTINDKHQRNNPRVVSYMVKINGIIRDPRIGLEFKEFKFNETPSSLTYAADRITRWLARDYS